VDRLKLLAQLAAVVGALISWFRNYRPEYKPALEEMQKEIVALGGTVRD